MVNELIFLPFPPSRSLSLSVSGYKSSLSLPCTVGWQWLHSRWTPVSHLPALSHICALYAQCVLSCPCLLCPPRGLQSPVPPPGEGGQKVRERRGSGREGKWKGGEVEGREVEGSGGQKREGDGPSTLHTYRINLGVAWERGYTQCRHDIHTINVHRNKRCMHPVSVLNLSSFLKPWNPP